MFVAVVAVVAVDDGIKQSLRYSACSMPGRHSNLISCSFFDGWFVLVWLSWFECGLYNITIIYRKAIVILNIG